MARLTWTPIVAPELADTLRAQQAAGVSLDRAFSGIGNVLDRYEGQRHEANLAELYARENAFAANNDVAGYVAAQGDGSLTKGLSYLRSGDIAGARSFTGEIRSARAADTAYTRGEQSFAREEADRASGILVAREANAIRADLAAGRINEAQATQRAADLSRKTQSAPQISMAYDAGRSGIADSRANTNWEREGVRFADSRQDRNWMVEDRTDAKQASALIEKYRGMGGTFTDLEGSEDWQKATPQQRVMIRQAFGGTADPGPFAGSIDMDAAKTSVVAHLQSQGATPAAIAGIMGNLEAEGGYSGKLGDGGSASGIAQWRGERRDAFKRRFGKDPHQATPAEQAQFLTWELLSPEGRAVSKVTQEQARQIWTATDPAKAAELFDQYYERSDGRTRSQRMAAARTFTVPSLDQNQAAANRTAINASTQLGTDGFAWMAKLPNAFADTASLASVAERITTPSKDGSSPLAGSNKTIVQQELQKVQNDYRKKNPGKTLTPAAAAIILEQAAVPYGGMDFFDLNTRAISDKSFAGILSPFQQGGQALDRNKIRETLSQIRFDKDGNVEGLNDTVNRVSGNQSAIANSGTALQTVEALRSKLAARKSEDARLKIFNNPATERLEQQFLLAQQQLDLVNGRASINARNSSGR